MSCYTRHLSELLAGAGVPATSDYRQALDGLLRRHLHVEGLDCPLVWQEIKRRRADPAAWKSLQAYVASHWPGK